MLEGYLPQLLIGLGITLKVACFALVFGLVMGIIGALSEFSANKWLKTFFVTFNSVIRGLPELLVLFFIYFGGTLLFTQIFHLQNGISSFSASVIALGLLFGAYSSQTFRGAFLAVPTGQLDAAKALGLNRLQSFYLILLPQAWRHALPGLSNLWLVLLKDTALVSLIGLSDLMMRTQVAAVTTQKPFTFYFTAALIYLTLTSISEVIMYFLTNRANRYLASTNL